MRKGFSLIELSIVLVIIGILIGGVMVGRSLLSSAKDQKVIADIQKFTQAANEFATKYGYSAGDFPDSANHWSGILGGDGDGTLEDPLIVNENEYMRFWQHLKEAGFITGNYTGLNFPSGALDRSFITHYYDDAAASDGYFQAFYLTGESSVELYSAAIDNPGVISGQDAYAIDMKIDDGLPGDATPDYGNAGSTGGTVQGAGNCITGAAYELTTDDLCSLVFYYKY